MYTLQRTGIGQSSRRFLPEGSSKPCMIGGIIFEDVQGFDADSDGDVIYQAICNSITSLTGVPILTGIALELIHMDGYTDSQVYLEHALATLGKQKVVHVALTLEGKKPRFKDQINLMREKIAQVMGLSIDQVGISTTLGDGLTDFGCGDGVQCFAMLSTIQEP
jgi:2-C-methyl-D-erythritol 2,4-cyclodiphosphate synthase